MSKRKSFIFGAVAYIVALVLVLVAVIMANNKYSNNFKPIVLFGMFILGAIVFGLLNAFMHEFGHIIVGKKNGFEILSFTIWFFKWTKKRKKYKFNFVMLGNEAGYTESVPKHTEDLDKRLVKMTGGGLIASFVLMILSIVPYIFVGKIPLLLFCFLSISLPISSYYFFWNILPIISEGVLNDGAIIYSVKKKTDSSIVMLSLLKIQSEMFNGKTPAEIDTKFYFDVPQLAEDDINFANLLNARYNYYLDCGDNENAIKTSERLLSLMDYLPKEYEYIIKADALYNYCTIAKNEEKADEFMYEVEKYLNGIVNATTIRIKTAYLLLFGDEEGRADTFYNKGIKEAKKCQIKGLGLFEMKLLDKLLNK